MFPHATVSGPCSGPCGQRRKPLCYHSGAPRSRFCQLHFWETGNSISGFLIHVGHGDKVQDQMYYWSDPVWWHLRSCSSMRHLFSQRERSINESSIYFQKVDFLFGKLLHIPQILQWLLRTRKSRKISSIIGSSPMQCTSLVCIWKNWTVGLSP